MRNSDLVNFVEGGGRIKMHSEIPPPLLRWVNLDFTSLFSSILHSDKSFFSERIFRFLEHA